ncbi:MAG: M4 family metallopeptidase [Bacteroidales bacterium]|nr:M4 family metallopeptidase [Bacteroidales bacterium]
MKNKIVLSFAIIATMLACSDVLHGQGKPSIIKHEIFPHWYYFDKEDGLPALTVNDFVPICKSEFRLSEKDELVVSKVTFLDEMAMEKSNPGRTRYAKYKQYYNGYEVESSVIISVDVSDTITVVTGNIVGDLDIDTSDPIAQSTALNAALNAVPGTFIWNDSVLMSGYCSDGNGCFDSICYHRFLPKGKLCLARKNGVEFKSTNFKFVWRFLINTTTGEYRVLINAKTGALFDVAEVTRRGYANGNVQTLYDGYIVDEMETYRPSITDSWTLQNSKGNKTVLNRKPVYNKTNDWIDTLQAPATTAHWIIGQLADFYATEYLNDTISDSTFINAGTGIGNQCFYTDNTNEIWLGRCDNYWLSTIDLVGHELAHRLVAQSAELDYQGESGALNESFADIFGTLAERFIRTNHGGSWNWTIGEDACTIRSMSDPPLYLQPDYYQGDYWFGPQSDSDEAHTNSGVQNKWFYLLSQAIGPDQAGLVAYNMLQLYLTPTANYYDALFASAFAAKDLFGRCSVERNAVISAWYSVGVNSNSISLCARSQQEEERTIVGNHGILPLIQEGHEWHTLVNTWTGQRNYLFSLEGDTIIDNVDYMKLKVSIDGDMPNLFGVFREEEGKVWGRCFNYDPSELLYYDFAANVGDVVSFGIFGAPYTVDSISVEHIGGVDRKKFWFGLSYDNMGSPHAIETWIEGIGSNLGLPWSGWGETYDFNSRLLCFHQNGELVWQDPAYNACSPEEVEEVNEKGPSIYPNPVIDKMVIEGVEAAEVRVYNPFGQLVKTEKGTNEIPMSGLPKGIYLLRITDVAGKSHGISVVKN